MDADARRMACMRTPALLGAIVAVGLTGAVVTLLVQARDLERRLSEVEAAGVQTHESSLTTPPESAPPPALAGVPVSLAQLEELERNVADLSARVAGGLGQTPSGQASTADVRTAVERLLEDEGFRRKLADAVQGTKVPKKPHIDVLTKALALDGGQDRRFREDLKDAQGELFALLAEKRPDGTVPLEEIQKTEALAEGDPGRAQAWLRLVKMQIPGTDQTYFEKAVEIAGGFRTKAAEYLRSDQQERFVRMDVDLFGVRFQ
jgi:hypothetical protein